MKKSVLILLSVLLLVGCGKAAPAPVSEAAPTAPPAAQSEAVPTAAPTAAPTPEPTPDAFSFLEAAKAALAQGEAEDSLAAALDAYLQALELDPASAEALLGAADVYIRQGDFDGALAFLKEQAGDAPDEAVQVKIAELEAGNAKDSEGKVRKVTGTAEDGPTYIHIYDYDDQGQLARVTWYDESGTEQDHVDILYDAQGRKLTGADHVTSSLLAGRLIHNEYVYDDQDRMISVKRILPGEWTEAIQYFFDDQGREVRWETYSNGRLSLIDTFEDFDDHNHAAKRSTYDAEGPALRLMYYQLFEYDYDTYTETERTYDASGALEDCTVITYASDWRTPLHWISYAPDGSVKREFHAEQGK